MENEILNIYQAIDALNDGEIVFLVEGKRTFFKLKNSQLLVKGNNYKAYLMIDDFLKLYHDAKFSIYEPKDDSLVDEYKDKEYYSWNHK